MIWSKDFIRKYISEFVARKNGGHFVQVPMEVLYVGDVINSGFPFTTNTKTSYCKISSSLREIRV